MLSQKRNLFKQGIGIFAIHFANHDQGEYLRGMVHQGGYVQAAQKFYEHSGYLTAEDRDKLYYDGTIPPWMVEVILEIETQLFGQTLFDRQ